MLLARPKYVDFPFPSPFFVTDITPATRPLDRYDIRRLALCRLLATRCLHVRHLPATPFLRCSSFLLTGSLARRQNTTLLRLGARPRGVLAPCAGSGCSHGCLARHPCVCRKRVAWAVRWGRGVVRDDDVACSPAAACGVPLSLIPECGAIFRD
jgi:hypothetical protein